MPNDNTEPLQSNMMIEMLAFDGQNMVKWWGLDGRAPAKYPNVTTQP